MTDEHYHRPNTQTANEFVQLALCMVTGQGIPAKAHEASKSLQTADRVMRLTQRAAVGAGTAVDLLADRDYTNAADAFAETLIGESAFETVFQSAIQVPMKTNVGVQSIAAAASLVAEGAPAPVSLADFTNIRLEPYKVIALMAVTDEVLRSEYSRRFIREALRHAVIQAQDGAFLDGIVGSGDIVASSAGTGAANALKDIRAAVAAVNIAGSRPYLVVDSVNAVALSTFDGSPFASATPQGGIVAGVPFVVCDAVGADSSGSRVVAIDAASLLMAAEPIVIDTSNQASLQMTTTPDDGAANLVSMFQTNSTALRLTRSLGFESVRAGAVAVVDGVVW